MTNLTKGIAVAAIALALPLTMGSSANAAPLIFVLQRLLELISDRALRIRAADIQRDFMHPFILCRDLRAPQNEPNLRPVAMTDGQVPSGFDHIRHMMGSLTQSLLLVLHSDVFIILNQRITTDSDYG